MRAKKANVTDTEPAVKRKLVNTETSSIGWSVWRSQAMNAASRRAATVKATIDVGDAHPWTGPSITAHTSVTMAAIDSSVPSGSKRSIDVSRELGTNRPIMTRAT